MLTKQHFTEVSSPRKCWELSQGECNTKANVQKGVCACGTSHHFKTETEDDPVEKLYVMEDLHVKLNNAGTGEKIGTEDDPVKKIICDGGLACQTEQRGNE